MNKKSQLELQKLVFAAMLVSIAIVIKVIFFHIPIPTLFKNIDVFLIFLILAGIILGPVYGGLAGIATDIIYIFMVGGDWGLFTLAHFSAGFIPGFYFQFLKYNRLQLLISLFLTIAVYLTITIYALDFYGYVPANWFTIYPRIIRFLIVYVPYFYIIDFLVSDQRFKSFRIYQNFYLNKLER